MKRCLALLVVAFVAACSSLPDAGDGVVSLEVLVPDSLKLTIGESMTLHARALNLQGESVPAVVYWRTPDTALVTLDSIQGVIVARVASGIARIQARTGTLLSNVISITLRDVPVELRTGPRP